MSFQKVKSDSYCVGGRHISATKNIYGDITSKSNIVLIGYCLICDRKKTTIVSDNNIHAERLIDFVKNLRKKGINLSKKLA